MQEKIKDYLSKIIKQTNEDIILLYMLEIINIAGTNRCVYDYPDLDSVESDLLKRIFQASMGNEPRLYTGHIQNELLKIYQTNEFKY